MLVSIVIPAYNAEESIIRLLDSITSIQDFDYEVIVVDDGSKDGTYAIALDYSRKHDRVRVFTKKNEGAPKARNAGLEIAKGDYICFLDSDDFINNGNIFKEAVCFASMHTTDILISDLTIKTDKDLIYMKAFPKRFDLLGEGSRFYFCDPIPGTKIYNHTFLEANGIIFDDVRIAQDLNLYIKSVSSAKNIQYFPQAYYTYCNYSTGISRTYKTSTILDIKKSFLCIEQHCMNRADFSRDQKKILEYVKVNNYTWQMRKKNHFNKRDFSFLRKQLMKDVNLIHYFDLKLFIVNAPGLFEYLLAKYMGIIIRPI